MIIESLLDTDLYKFNMMRIFIEKFFNSYGRYVFKCRTPNIKFTPEMFKDIGEELRHVATLRFSPEEIDYIKNIRYHSTAYGYLNFLKMFQLDMSNFKKLDLHDGKLEIEVEGPIFQVSMWETFVLAIVQETYWKHTIGDDDVPDRNTLMHDGINKLLGDLEIMHHHPFLLIEFGTRRRFSKGYQEAVLKILLKQTPEGSLFGTSNVELAKKYRLRPCGTMAHEYICLGQALKHVPIGESQTYMLDQWYDLYGDSLGTALSDTLGTDKFLKDFTPRYAKLYDGVRHDSGDPLTWGNKIIEHYTSMGIDHKTKVLFFSDSLTLEKASEIKTYFKKFHDHYKISFGIGTALTNNIPGITPLNLVMKLVEANGRPVAKISDESGKTMCEDEKYLEYLRYTINN